MRMSALLLAMLLVGQEERIEKGAAPSRPLRPSADPELQKLLAAYEIPGKEFDWQLRELKDGERVRISWLTFPSPLQGEVAENNTVWAKYWHPKAAAPDRRPAALLLHWLGGSYDTLELIGLRLAENGIPALMMYMPYYGPRRPKDRSRKDELMTADLEKSFGNFRQAVMDVRRAGDWLASRPGVEPSRVGIVGISLGAIVGALSAGVDDRFGRSVFIIGGGDLASIVYNGSKETALIKKRLEEAGVAPDRFRELGRNADPLTFAARLRPEELLMINAESDEVIPRECTLKLHEAAGRPDLRWFKGGHTAVIFQLGPVLKDILVHLTQRTAY
jgi:dienelactone hydrolase